MGTAGSSVPFGGPPETAEGVDPVFLTLVLALLALGLAVLYSASYAQSEYDTLYTVSPAICSGRRCAPPLV